jgi:hypothetical protein
MSNSLIQTPERRLQDQFNSIMGNDRSSENFIRRTERATKMFNIGRDSWEKL